MAGIKNRTNDARRTQTSFWTGLEESKTDAQAGFLDLLVSFCPPMLRIVPVIRPTAKNAKYMRAAGSCTWDVNKGGRLKSTCARLCKPINTKSMKIAATNNILINNIAFISFLCGAARWLFSWPRRPVKSNLLAILRLSAVTKTPKGGATQDEQSTKRVTIFITPVSSSMWCQPCRCARRSVGNPKRELRTQTVQNSISFAVAARPLLV